MILRWGSRNSPFDRLLPNYYDDGVESPRVKANDDLMKLKRARYLANLLTEATPPDNCDNEDTPLALTFGEFVMHDIAKTAKSSSDCSNMNCNTTDRECFNIPIPPDDAFLSSQGECIRLTRGADVRGLFNCHEIKDRRQYNENTHWLDLSGLYGSSLDSLKVCRIYEFGKLRSNVVLIYL